MITVTASIAASTTAANSSRIGSVDVALLAWIFMPMAIAVRMHQLRDL